MEKTLLNNIEDFKSFIDNNTGRLPFYGNTTTYFNENEEDCRPIKYPCIVVWDIWDDPNGPAYLDGEFVYLDDFNEE